VVGVVATGFLGVGVGMDGDTVVGGVTGLMAWSFFNWFGEIEKTWLSARARVASEMCKSAIPFFM
jgi:hypothetical protein